LPRGDIGDKAPVVSLKSPRKKKGEYGFLLSGNKKKGSRGALYYYEVISVYFFSVISVLLFMARLSSVSLGTAGLVSP